ncbi:interleukin-8-like [Arapaima gigas]
MELTHRPLCLLLACLAYTLLQAQTGDAVYVPTSCLCPHSNKFIHFSLIKDFSVTKKGALCNTDAIVVTLNDNTKACLNPSFKQGQNLLACWKRINKDKSQMKTCLRRRNNV